MALLGQIVAAAPNDSTTWLRLARTIMQIRPADDKEKALLLERASTAAYIAYQRTTSRNEEADSLAFLGHALALARTMAAGARCAPPLARIARGRRRARPIRAAARGARLPRARLQRRCRHRLAARLLPVLGRFAGAHRFLAVRGAGRHRQAGLVGGGEAALRRRLAARRDLQGHVARRPAVHRARDVVEIGRVRHLCARPQAVGALHHHLLCAAAHRPARHSGHQHQHQGGGDRNLPARRPQPGRYRHRRKSRPRRLPAEPEPLRRRAVARVARRVGVEGRTHARIRGAERRRHHRVSGRSGGRRAQARRLRHGGAAAGDQEPRQQFRGAGDAMVHRLRSRLDRVFRQ